MDITRFINSRDIFVHFKTAFHEEDYPDLALRYAWLIWQSRYTSFAEKHRAWQEIIDSFPDMEIPARRRAYSTFFTLHDFLTRYMDAEKNLLSLMYADEKDVAYQIQTREKDSRLERMCWLTDHALYPDYRSCLDSCKEGFSSQNVYGFLIEKRWITSGNRLTLLLSPDGSPLQIDSSWVYDGDEEELFCVFCDMWFAYPTPFQRGDLVCSPDSYSADVTQSKPFVLNLLCTEFPSAKELERTADSTDMTAYGYFARRDGGIYYDCEHNYMDLEFYRNQLTGGSRVLKGISSFLKGQIDVGLLLNSHHLLRLKAKNDELTERLDYTQEGLELCGLDVDLGS